MKFSRDLSDPQVAQALRKLGYEITRPTGSHIRLTRTERARCQVGTAVEASSCSSDFTHGENERILSDNSRQSRPKIVFQSAAMFGASSTRIDRSHKPASKQEREIDAPPAKGSK